MTSNRNKPCNFVFCRVAARIALISAATILTGGLIGMGIVGTASAITSFKPAHRHGVLADGRTVTIKSSVNEYNIPLLAITFEGDPSIGDGTTEDRKISGDRDDPEGTE